MGLVEENFLHTCAPYIHTNIHFCTGVLLQGGTDCNHFSHAFKQYGISLSLKLNKPGEQLEKTKSLPCQETSLFGIRQCGINTCPLPFLVTQGCRLNALQQMLVNMRANGPPLMPP